MTLAANRRFLPEISVLPSVHWMASARVSNRWLYENSSFCQTCASTP